MRSIALVASLFLSALLLVSVLIAASAYLQLCQITAGFIILPDDDDVTLSGGFTLVPANHQRTENLSILEQRPFIPSSFIAANTCRAPPPASTTSLTFFRQRQLNCPQARGQYTKKPLNPIGGLYHE